jgi:hypothetical protein
MFNLRTKMVNHYVDAGSKCGHVRWVNGREHANTQLVTAQFAVTVRIHNAVGAQNGTDGVGVNAIDINRCNYIRALRRVCYER